MSVTKDTIQETSIAIWRHLEKEDISAMYNNLFDYNTYIDNLIGVTRQEIIDSYYNLTNITQVHSKYIDDVEALEVEEKNFANQILKNDKIKDKLTEMSLAVQSTYTGYNIEIYKITNDIKAIAKISNLVLDYVTLTDISQNINNISKFNNNNLKNNESHIKYFTSNEKYSSSVIKLKATRLKDVINLKKTSDDIYTILEYALLVVNNAPEIIDIVEVNTNEYIRRWLQNDERFKIN